MFLPSNAGNTFPFHNNSFLTYTPSGGSKDTSERKSKDKEDCGQMEEKMNNWLCMNINAVLLMSITNKQKKHYILKENYFPGTKNRHYL